MRRLPLAFLLVALASACTSAPYSFGSSTAAGQASRVNVLGKRPRMLLENFGPGVVRVELDGPGEAYDETLVLPPGRLERTARGPLHVRIEPQGDRPASWRLRAWNSGGLDVDLLVETHGGS